MQSVVVGAGDISSVHLPALASIGATVAAVVDHDLERARRAAPDGAQVFTDVEDALTALGTVDVVHVCTPHDQHLPVVATALRHGAHVLVEKPLAHTLADAERLAAVAAEAGTKVGVCFQNRYNTTSQRMRRVLADGTLGAVTGGTATVAWSRGQAYYAAKPWAGQRARSGGGVLINQAIHTIDLLQWLLGPVATIAGHADQLRPLEGVDVEDTATFTLAHAGGVRSTMWASNTNVVNNPVTIDIACERGALSLRGDLTITDADGGTTVVTDSVLDTDAPSYWGASHAALIADFYSRLDEPGPFWIDPSEALASQRILDAVYRQS